MNLSQSLAQPEGRAQKLYFAAWRWHFYTGLFVIPFLTALALTGLAMLWIAWIDGRDGELTAVVQQAQAVPLSVQADAALTTVPDGVLRQYVAPREADLAALFRVDHNGDAIMVAVDPYTAKVVETFPRRSGWYDFADGLHSDLMLGVTGDRLLETAASLSLVLIATGLYMWWPRTIGWRRALLPSPGHGRSLWKSLHGVTGIWVSLFLVLFLVSGLAWAGIWGGKMVQAWSQFPAEKWDNVPLSDDTHASMDHARREVPWALEQTPMPASGSDAGVIGIADMPVDLDSVDALARQIGFAGRYQLSVPRNDSGVWTLSRDSMSTDSNNPTSDRTVHIDRHTGKILADVQFADYSWAGKAMAVGIALHMGTLGLWSVLANTLVCVSVLFLCVSAVVLWWKRRPVKARRLSAPPMPKELPLWRGAVFVGLAVSMAFPMAGLALLTVLLLDLLILSRVPQLRQRLT
ncbi:PepSY-associated TM helix domain-containing protein [Phaeobacter porticola]|uniref:Putative iron-regulated membrane protein n=1 Tax=Phaeobacter porticola TaxID=1844006 RepID=A0A1L3IAI6_9RHOB|nr:PepSY domain-containing protein [Phaeobacter porticola]APG49082.1 putative iron-regulated membrane protein [Phaeobacter porticola]